MWPQSLQLSASSSAKSGADGAWAGSSTSYGGGSWNLNMGGSGQQANGASAGQQPPWMLIGLAVVVVLLLRK
jgi:hypothetical protein